VSHRANPALAMCVDKGCLIVLTSRWSFDCATEGQLIGPQADSGWLYVVPWGFGKLLHWVADRYDNPGIYVTENGTHTE
jgi:hypothetical protein